MPAISKPLLGRQSMADAWRAKQGAFVRDLRHDAQMTQEEVAEAIGCGKSFVCQIEIGRSHVPPDKIAALAAAVGKTPQEISKPLLRFQNPWIYANIFGTDDDPELKRFIRNVPEHINLKRGPRW